MISLSDGATTLTLPDGLLWADEWTWRAVEQSVTTTLTGALVVEVATRQAGRPITLKSGTDYAWIIRADLDQLNAWADMPGKELALSIRGVSRPVIFRHQDTAIEAEMILHKSAPAQTDYYQATIRLMEI